MAEQWEYISPDQALEKDDVVRIWFEVSTVGPLAAYQIDQIDGKLEGNPDFEVLNHTYPDDENRMYWTCRVKHNPLTAGAIAVVIASLAAVVAIAWMTLKPYFYERVLKTKERIAKDIGTSILESEAQKWGDTAIKIGLAAVGIIVAMKWWKG